MVCPTRKAFRWRPRNINLCGAGPFLKWVPVSTFYYLFELMILLILLLFYWGNHIARLIGDLAFLFCHAKVIQLRLKYCPFLIFQLRFFIGFGFWLFLIIQPLLLRELLDSESLANALKFCNSDILPAAIRNVDYLFPSNSA